jgi:UDP:flavonoid glycosyltransferase YjiC (YdhE family)
VVVTAGPGADPALLGDWPSRVRITDFVPQERLLPHCRLVISHGGAGSVIGALRHGLPQLVLPRGADNDFNAAAVRGAGAGLSLAPAELTPESVAAAAHRLLTDPSFTAAAREIATEIAEMPAPADVLARLLD